MSAADEDGMNAFGRICAVLLLLPTATPLMGQNEAELRKFFEGKRVGLRIDMPATSEGVDIRPGTEIPLDYKVYGHRLAEAGTAIRTGDTAVVTNIHVKRDLVEFQLNGGGFGYESSWVYVPSADKSNHERDLEKQIKTETDPSKKRSLEREMDDLRSARERENARISLERSEAEEQKKARIAVERLQAGSRFNLRYNRSIPESITSRDIINALADYVDFTPSASSGIHSYSAPAVHKGMLRSEVERDLGMPVYTTVRKEGALTVSRLTFLREMEQIVADFIEDVLFHYTVTAE